MLIRKARTLIRKARMFIRKARTRFTYVTF
jgi:hypothetical protein